MKAQHLLLLPLLGVSGSESETRFGFPCRYLFSRGPDIYLAFVSRLGFSPCGIGLDNTPSTDVVVAAQQRFMLGFDKTYWHVLRSTERARP